MGRILIYSVSKVLSLQSFKDFRFTVFLRFWIVRFLCFLEFANHEEKIFLQFHHPRTPPGLQEFLTVSPPPLTHSPFHTFKPLPLPNSRITKRYSQTSICKQLLGFFFALLLLICLKTHSPLNRHLPSFSQHLKLIYIKICSPLSATFRQPNSKL